MESFRGKYIYNSSKPIFESDAVQTFNCLNTETKDNRLIILKHIKEPSFVEQSAGVLQPIQSPTIAEPMSVYPLVYCCSQIGRINESDAMYILKCLLQCKPKKPIYYVLAPQGICCSEIEGILPNPSPDINSLLLQMLNLSEDLKQNQANVLSKQAFQICKGLRQGDNVDTLIANYGWQVPKKDKEVKDNQFWIFKGRRKDEGPFGQEYGLAWFARYGLSRFRLIDLTKDGYEEEFFEDFTKKIEFYRQNKEKSINTIEIFKYVKEAKSIRIFFEILNQGTLTEYITRQHQMGHPLTERKAIQMMEGLAVSMRELSAIREIGSHAALHIRNLYIHDHKIVMGEPLLITDKIEKKLRELKSTYDYYAPQMKQNIILPENLFKLNFEKFDIWSFGMILHRVIARQLPTFDANRHAITNRGTMSPGMSELITRCLSINPADRPSWRDINIHQIATATVVEQVREEIIERQQIRLGSRKERKSESVSRKRQEEEIRSELKVEVHEQVREQAPLEEKEFIPPIPIELSSRLKKIKLIIKIILIMVLYTFVFFRSFLGNSIGILLVRSFYSTVGLNLVDSTNNILSTTTVITSTPNFFLLNDISFTEVQNTYHCINNQFDPISNPDYSLLSYIQSGSFLALLLCGWLGYILICITKALSIWRGGISNRPAKGIGKYWVVYVFHELSLASLLFAHFYIFQFFYFASGQPCFNIQSYSGIQPFFDSTLYLFLFNSNGYFQQVFSSLGVLALLVVISTCYYAWGPKLDVRYFLSVPSILLRIIPYVLLVLICRIGVFMLFTPSAINDATSILPAVISGSAQGFFGVIPQMFVLICMMVEALLEMLMYCCEIKAAESDRFSKLFNIKRKKKVEMDESNDVLNDMSHLDVSKLKLNSAEMFT